MTDTQAQRIYEALLAKPAVALAVGKLLIRSHIAPRRELPLLRRSDGRL